MAKRGPRSVVRNGDVAGSRPVRCAIYTRKSTEEGLEQEFNSLDAQREACAAYILSQRHEGWRLVETSYDDGGFSGGTMERPGLKRLLADVETGKVDVIVVYKVDRLTRALSDFAKIVEILDARGASFVSITQAFNTTTSMGRLTLNVLLSFAQFEREVTGERIRDKIAASKKKGMWMGGPVPLGYDVKDRRLLINETEAATVQLIFRKHLELRSLRELAANLANRGIRSKLRTMRDGRLVGGKPYTVGALAYLLRNVLYTGHIRHGDQIYPGEHQAIIDQDLWEGCQALLNGDSAKPRPRTGQISLLNGLLQDALGRPMTSAHAIKGNRRYRYYVSRPRESQAESPWRIPAGDLESLITRGLIDALRDPLRLIAELGDTCVVREGFAAGCSDLALRADDADALRSMLQQLHASITVRQDMIIIALNAPGFLHLVGGNAAALPSDQILHLRWPVSLKRRGHELRLVYHAPDARPAERDDRLIQLLASGRAAFEQLRSAPDGSSEATRSHLVRLARLHFLAPDIITAILEGRQPVELTSRALLRIAELPLAWTEQRRILGFA